MQNNYELTNNGINTLLNELEINKIHFIDMYFQLLEYKISNVRLNLYTCTMRDENNEYNNFLLKGTKGLNVNDIIHVKKVGISISGEKKIINCLIYEIIKFNDLNNRNILYGKLREKKEKEKNDELIKKQREEEINKKRKEEYERIKKIEEDFRKKRLEEEERKKKLEEDELNKKRKLEEERRKKLEEEEFKRKKIEEEINKARMEEELKKKKLEEEERKKKMEEELRIKQREEERNNLLNEVLVPQTNLALTKLRHEEKTKRYNFKWEKGNLKWINLLGKLSEFSDEKEKSIDFDFSSDTEEVKENEIIDMKKKEEKKEEKMDIYEQEKEKENKIIEENSENIYNSDKKEVEDIFKGINIKEIFKLNKKTSNQSKKLQQEFELLVNLSRTNYKKPIYVKCIKKILLDKKKKKFIYYIFRDSEGAEISAYTYGAYHIKNLDNQIKQEGVYIISRYRVKHLSYTNQINNNYSLILNTYTKIDPMPPDSVFNNIHFHFLTIEDLFFFKEGCLIDTCGVIYDEGEPRIYNMKIGQQFMRNVLIADASMKKMVITLYEPFSKDMNLKIEKGQILAIKYGKIGITNTKIKKLTTSRYSILQNSTGDYNHDMLLKEFYENNQEPNNFVFIFRQEDYKYLKDIKQIIEYNTEHNVVQCQFTFVTKAYVENFSLDEDSIYKGCPLCSKKLISTEDNKYECLPCQKTYTQPKYLYKLTFKVRDAESNAFFKLLGIKATKLLEVEPEVVKKYIDDKNYSELSKLEEKVLFNEYIFTATLNVFGNDKNGKVLHNININNMERADGENLKRIIDLIHDED